jgi:hypothetical protein
LFYSVEHGTPNMNRDLVEPETADLQPGPGGRVGKALGRDPTRFVPMFSLVDNSKAIP